jgi:hypothetical protein
MVLLLLSACIEHAPARIVVDGDTVLVNSRQPVALPIRLIDSAGRTVRARGVRYTRASGDSLRVAADGRVTCTWPEDAAVLLSQGSLTARVAVKCRPIASFRMSPPLHFAVGDPAEAPVLNAVGPDGKPVSPIEASARSRDTTVARVRDGRVQPVGRGLTRIDVEAGGVTSVLFVEVLERVASPEQLAVNQEFQVPLRLAGGELRSWRLAPGLYELRLDASGAGSLALAAFNANCARYSDRDDHYSCVTGDRGAVIVRNPLPAGAKGADSGVFVVARRACPKCGRPTAATGVELSSSRLR